MIRYVGEFANHKIHDMQPHCERILRKAKILINEVITNTCKNKTQKSENLLDIITSLQNCSDNQHLPCAKICEAQTRNLYELKNDIIM